MRNVLIVLLIVAVAAFAGLFVQQRNRAVQLQSQLASTQNELQSLQEQLKERAEADRRIVYTEKKTKLLQDTLAETSKVAAQQSEEVSKLQQVLAAAETNADTSKALAGMFKDPAMKEMIKAQQQAYIRPMIDRSYDGFCRQLNMTPEQSALLKDLLEKKMLVTADLSMAAMQGNMDATKRAELTQQIKSGTDEYDARIRQFLGDDNYREFQNYELSVPDRLAVGQFHDQLAGSSMSLTRAQEKQLIQLMQEERTAFKWTSNFGNRSPDGTMSATLPNDEQLAKYADEKAQLDRQILARARLILSPEQAAALERYQVSQNQMQISAMKLAGKMFAPK
jgi:hypothetical protein